MKKKLLSLILICLGATNFVEAQVFSENWDGIGPGIAGWTLYNQDGLTPNSGVSFVNAAWVLYPEEFDNKVSMSTSWYTPAGTSNDWLVSPSIVLPAGTNKLYWDAQSYDATYKESYKVYISTTGNAIANFTEIFSQGNGTSGASGENTTWTRRTLDLSAYSGQTVYIAFRNFSNDMFLMGLDDISIVNHATCTAPDRVASATSTNTTVSLNWNAVPGATGYDLAIGAPGFTPTTATGTSATNSYTFTGLTANTRYQVYVRNSCGSMWMGPYSVFTSRYLPYTYGFETPLASGGYEADGWSGNFSLNNSAGAPFYADGVQMVFSNSSTTAATNNWMFSRPITLAAGEQVTMKFSTRSTSGAVANTLLAKVGNAPTTAAQTTTLSTVNVIGTTFVETTANFTAPSAGVYYFSFNHNNGATAAATSLVLDKIVMTTNLSANSFVSSKFSVYPNPVNNIVTLTNDANIQINKVAITDINGRTVKTLEFNGVTETQINVSDLNSGIYFMNIDSSEGAATKKIIKN
ncbi:MAG TPA: choice-of-anchor J domain-containing protein [Flavobacterium sp.]|uniref:T9SS-dependent choice-of-anchor J family protein n=1 Tax=Flavobacterium sp. TaxID=239 RepID=UPI002B568052|nr:choice-of-anchor J domain-containing protein [Flavobacterium sp.]HSD13745.1 choice-of-anchor J domain-containing protein [Flavobacterium sp.]